MTLVLNGPPNLGKQIPTVGTNQQFRLHLFALFSEHCANLCSRTQQSPHYCLQSDNQTDVPVQIRLRVNLLLMCSLTVIQYQSLMFVKERTGYLFHLISVFQKLFLGCLVTLTAEAGYQTSILQYISITNCQVPEAGIECLLRL